MKKILFTLYMLFSFITTIAQVGINTLTPNSTLSIEGSIEKGYSETKTNLTLNNSNYYVSYTGTEAGTLTLPVIGNGATAYTGRLYKIKNLSNYNLTVIPSSGNTIRSENVAVASFLLSPGAYIEIINNANTSNGTWDLSFLGESISSNVEVYGNQLYIPPHATFTADFTSHNNSSYDSKDKDWWVISKTSTASVANQTTARMVIVYEYQGKPFELDNMYCILSTGNNSNLPDIFTPSFVSLKNDGTDGKTRLSISVARIDNQVNSWQETFLLNFLLAKKTY